MDQQTNDRVVSFGQDISDVRYVTTTKHPASVMMLGVVASNGEKMQQCVSREVTGLQMQITGISLSQKILLGSEKSPKVETTSVSAGWCSSAHVQNGPSLDEPKQDILAPTVARS